MEKKIRKENARTAMTRGRLIDAAEQVFAEQGYRGASLRVISEQAEANIAATNYHFGGKEGLFRAVMLRYAPIIRDERLRLLSLLNKANSTRDIVDAYLLPTFNWLKTIPSHKSQAPFFLRLLGSCEIEAPHLSHEIMTALYEPVRQKLTDVLREHYPNASPQNIFWALFSGESILFGCLIRLHKLHGRSHGLVTLNNIQNSLKTLADQIEAVYLLLDESHHAGA